MKVLITAGATREPIDRVRFISNGSTGRTGARLAEELSRLGHTVILFRGTGAAEAAIPGQGGVFSTASDLWSRLEGRLRDGSIDAVIMAAAVADYRPASAEPGKMDSSETQRHLVLVRTEKILPRIKSFSPRPLKVVGFKLTAGASDAQRSAAVARQFSSDTVDLVVHNDLDEISEASHPFRLYTSAKAEPAAVEGVAALAQALHRALGG